MFYETEILQFPEYVFLIFSSIVDSLVGIQGSAHVVVVYVLMTNTILIYRAYILLYY